MLQITSEAFRFDFLNYIHNGQLTDSDKLLSLISSRFVFKKNARKVSREFKKLNPTGPDSFIEEIRCEKYAGTNRTAIQIAAYLDSNVKDSILGLYVHGSVGTYEEISYSDFDGLVIIKNTCIENADELYKLAVALKKTEMMMHEMDPLQHHGWFVLSEADLPDYPESYFPHVLFSDAKCISGSGSFPIHLRKEGYGNQFRKSFEQLSASILTKLTSKSFLENYYVFKNFLSQFMLLPAVYLQTQTGKSINKKSSFEILEREMGQSYAVMHEISLIRQQWNYNPPDKYLAKLRDKNLFSNYNAAIKFSGILSRELSSKFDSTMIQRLSHFVSKLRQRVSDQIETNQ
jgi:hypothetical protein